MSSRSLALFVLAAAIPLARPLAAQQSGARSIEILDPSEQVCRGARTLRPRQAQNPLCVVGLAVDPAGVARVTLNGQPARITPDSASGGVRFVGWIVPGTGETRVEVALEPKAGDKLVRPYGFTPEAGTSAEGTSYVVRNLTPRVLGGGPATVAQAPAPAPAPASPAAQTASAEQPAAAAAAPQTSAQAAEPAAQPASAPSTALAAASSTPQPAASTSASAPSPAPASTEAPAPASQTLAQAGIPANTAAASTAPAPSSSPAAPSVAPAASAPGTAVAAATGVAASPQPAVSADAAPTASAAEDSRTYVQILEPAEWSGMATRSITVAPRSSVRVIGLAQHASGVARIDVNGVRASYSPDASGAQRFVAFVPADANRRDVEIVVRGTSGPPLVKHYAVQPAAQPTVQLASAGGSADAAARTVSGRFRGRRWAVVVGVSQYSDQGIAGLRYADADARAFYDFLRSPRAGGGGFADENVKLLLNADATYRNVRSALFTFLKGATEDDEVVIYFAGHGAPDPQRLSNLYLLTYDTDLADISGSAFPMDDVSKAIHSLYAHDVVVITDACHSAGIGGQGGTRDLGVNQINDIFLERLSGSTGGLAIFTASGANQVSYEDPKWGGGHGVFTHYLLEGLNGAADDDGDRIVSITEMMEYARGKVRVDTRNAQIPTISQTNYDPYLPMSIVLDSAASAQAAALAVGPTTPAAAPVPASADASGAAPAARSAPATAAQLAAVTAAQRKVELYPGNAGYRRELAAALRQAGRPDSAIAQLQEAARLDPGEPDFVYEMGVTLRAAGRDREAAAQFEAATRAESRNATYFNALGNTLMALGQTDDAIDRLRRAVSLKRDEAGFHRDLGAALVKLGRASDAVGELRQAVTLDPRNGRYHVELADALAGAGRQDEALVEYAEATHTEPAVAAHHAAYGRALKTAGQPSRAAEELSAAVRGDSANASYHHDLGGLRGEQGQPFEMLTEYAAAARLAPQTAQYRYDYGMALLGARQNDAAVSELRAAANLQPDNALFLNGLGGAIKASAGSPAEAQTALAAAVKNAPDNARYHYDLAVLYRDMGRMEDAVAELEAATRLDPRNRDYRAELTSLRNRGRND